jgi:putative transposase
MARPLLIRSETHPYHVTSRSNNKEFFPIPLKEVWMIMMEQLKIEVKEHALAVHAFVLMGNHFHLLCHTPHGNLDQIMQRFLRMTSVKINTRNRSINHVWGNRYKWSLIESQAHYFQVYRYIFQNPIRAKICHKVESYPFSTLHPCPIPLHSFIPMSFGGQEGELLWLNEVLKTDDQEVIKLGLKKQHFEVSKRNLKLFNKLTPPSKR